MPQTHEETSRGHGRIETRRIEVVPVGAVQWPWLRQWGRITRTRVQVSTGKTTTEAVYFITSRGPSQATPKQLLTYNRKHWAIENNLHRTRDTLMKEDASTLRKGAAPQTAVALRNIALRFLASIHPSPTQAREIAQNNRNDAILLLT